MSFKPQSLLLLAFILILTQHQQCHYSCLNCTDSYYTNCLACSDTSNNLTVLEDPDQIDPLHRHSLFKSGICTGKVPSGANGLGIILLIVSVSGLLITQSFQGFFIISTLQTLGLFSLLEVAWIGTASFILQSFQYFMPINLMVGPSKNNDQNLFLYGFYRLDEYMISSEDKGLIAIFAIDSVLFISIILVFVFTFLRKNQDRDEHQRYLRDESSRKQQQREENGNNLIPEISHESERFEENQRPSQPNRNENPNQFSEQPPVRGRLMKLICDKFQQCLVLRKVLHILIYIFFFFVQETVLSIMVGAVFDIGLLDIIIWIVYFIQVITVLVIAFYELEVDKKLNLRQKKTHQFGLSLFMSRQCMFLVILKKIILPLGIVLPPSMQYLYFVFYLILFLIEGTLDSRSKRMACMSRLTLWKIFEMFITTLILSFYFNEKKGALSSSANIINIILTILLIVFMISLLVEFVVSFVGIFMSTGSNRIQNESNQRGIQNSNMMHLNNTEMTMNEAEEGNQNIFQSVEITRENTTNQIYTENQRHDEFPVRNTQINNQIRIEEIYDIEIDPIEPPRKQSDLVISKTKINQSLPSLHQETSTKNQADITEKSNSTKIDRSQNEDRSPKPTIPRIEPYSNQDNVEQKDNNSETDQKDGNEEINEKKKARKRIMNPQIRKIYGLK